MITIVSFSYRAIPKELQGFIIHDTRQLRNPWSEPSLKKLDGRNFKVREYVMYGPAFAKWITAIFIELKPGQKIAFGCIGGRHRSVACAEILADACRERQFNFQILHNELEEETK